MRLLTPSDDQTVATPNAVMTRLATPSLGSSELSTWRARMEPGASGPAHTMNREQVWLPLSGTLLATVDEHTVEVGPGQALLLPAGERRQVRATAHAPVEVLVCMAAGGRAELDNGETRQVPWAE